MPRGKPKTREQVIREMEERKEWLKRQPPLKSPCVEGRRRHRFRSPKTFGKPTDDMTCWWCGKTYGQVKKEQRR